MNATFPMPVFTGDTPLYEQLYRHISAAIQSGHVAPGEKLPSKRQLCAALGVSMSTVEAAYSLLAAEGYVIPRPRSGYVAAQVVPLATDPAAHALPAREVESLSSSPWDYSFSTGAVDTSVFPFASWARITKEAVYQNPELLQRGHPQGDLPLREALADFLAQYRGVRCRPDQVIVGAGADYLLSLVLQLLPDQRDIALEDPGYPAAYATPLHHQRQVVPIPVDAEGMDPDALDRSGARLAYVTPSHQFPLGITMPAGRRSRLLQWAYAGPDRYLIEDDYDSEFRHTSRPIPAMQGVDRRGRVIYLGTFSRSIAPAIRVAYLPAGAVPAGISPGRLHRLPVRTGGPAPFSGPGAVRSASAPGRGPVPEKMCPAHPGPVRYPRGAAHRRTGRAPLPVYPAPADGAGAGGPGGGPVRPSPSTEPILPRCPPYPLHPGVRVRRTHRRRFRPGCRAAPGRLCFILSNEKTPWKPGAFTVFYFA